MLALDARFTVLAIFCGLATQWAVPGATVHAAVISRTPDDQPQHVFPWSGKGRPGSSKATPEGGWKHKVRMNDYHPSNPFGRFIDGIVSKIKRPHRPHKRSHSSILIPSNHGVAYALPHSRRDTPLWRVEPVAPPEDDSENDDDDDDSENERRAVDVTDGFVAIKSSDKTLAWLFLTGTNGQYILNAAENEKTLATLHKLSSAVTGTTGEIPVTLQIHPPDAETKSLAVANPLCATYNPNPSQPQPMTVTDCVDQTSPGRTEEGSQTFLLDEGTGVIRPTFVKGQADGKTDKPAAAQAADSPSSSSSSSSSSTSLSADLPSPTNSSSSASAITPDAAGPTNGTQPSNGAQTNSTTALNPRALKPAPAAQNVILVFVPASKGQSAATADVDSSAIDAQNSTVASSELTTTMTRTVTVFAAQTGASSSFTASDSASAAASQSVNSIGVELVSGSPPVSTIVSSTISAQAFASASASASSTEASAAAASVTVYPSSSVNAAAVASSLAASASASTSSAAAAASAAALASASSSAGASGTATPEAISSTSASASASSASTASGSSNTFVAAVVEREAVSTEPYQWAFVADKRL
ncbi:hypothetical protein M413DRAFT_8835 [Hebeloma cylindrosporum]|uniref:Uncharacterized protein n=1 Tax=Hebeloma cylindrosporum TaxID=76867 RepID=A0A0C2YTN7_HEBCY|nr:hypothetical protein M413DRAFT_8835 [Hebeloma cylindrosporum h7]